MGNVQRDLNVAIRRQIHAFEALRELLAAHIGLGLTEFVALGQLYDDGQLTARELGDRLHLTSGSVTALINRLEASGYAERMHNPDDRRSVLVTICDAGIESWDWVVEQTAAPMARAVRSSDVTTRGAIKLLDSFTAQIDKLAIELG